MENVMQIIHKIRRSRQRRLRFSLSAICGALLFLFIYAGILSQAYPLYGQETGNGSAVYDPGSSSTINFDGRMLAGLNGDSMFALSMTQGLRDFAYQINSSVVYTNDFEDYSNSSFIKNDTGFTGEISLADDWKLIPQFEIANSTYGMFDNAAYTRENKDSIYLRLKTEYKPGPDRWGLDLSGARYDHTLKVINVADEDGETFYLGRATLSMEHIWSDANKYGLVLDCAGYNYPEIYPDDAFASGEFYFSFKITEYIMPTIVFPRFIWDRDGTNYIYAKAVISSLNLDVLSLELSHDYRLEPYRPEELFKNHKYVHPGLDLPPSRVNHTELKSKFDFVFPERGEGALSLISMALRFSGFFEDSTNFCNYITKTENVLDVQAVPVKYVNGRAEFVTTFMILGQKVNADFSYNYFKYFPGDSGINITYRPGSVFTFALTLDGPWIEVEWINSWKGPVYISPDNDNRLDAVLAGTLDIHLKVYDTFYIDSSISNLYNRKYNYRDGYPEPGIQFYAGLRVMI